MTEVATQTEVVADLRMHWLGRFIYHACRVTPMTMDDLKIRVKRAIKPYTRRDVTITATEMLNFGILTRLDDGRLGTTGEPVP